MPRVNSANAFTIVHRATFALACASLALFTAAGNDGGSSAPADPDAVQYGPPRRLAELADERIGESSGLAPSRSRPGVYWTHNDSGDEPRVFAVNRAGQTEQTVTIAGAAALDWEDMASFRDGDESYLLLADVGDNGRRRRESTIYIVREPRADAASAAIAQTVRFVYEDGPHDCEAVAVDPDTRTILLIEKTVLPRCGVFELPLPRQATAELLTARRAATLNFGLVTAMDVSPDGARAIVLTYGDAVEFRRAAGETWSQALARDGRRIVMPTRRQGEAICYGADGFSLLLTSEKPPVPLWELTPREPPRQPEQDDAP